MQNARTLGMLLSMLSLFQLGDPAAAEGQSESYDERVVQVTSTLDDTPQPVRVLVPKRQKGNSPLLVSLHTWSGDYRQRNHDLERLCMEQGWIYLFPNFRGRNDHPDACGSRKAQQDILDAVAWATREHNVDQRRIYLTGVSGGGHMTLLMAARHPEVWAAASAWVGISDLSQWHATHLSTHYGKMLRNCCGGAPGDSSEVDQQYRERSPVTFLHQAAQLPIDIAAGIHDGHQGSVPIRHSLAAFNCLAKAQGVPLISDDEINQLSQPNGSLTQPLKSDRVQDPTFGRQIHLRRHAGPSRMTIFEGGHEGIAKAAIEWLARHRKL